MAEFCVLTRRGRRVRLRHVQLLLEGGAALVAGDVTVTVSIAAASGSGSLRALCACCNTSGRCLVRLMGGCIRHQVWIGFLS